MTPIVRQKVTLLMLLLCRPRVQPAYNEYNHDCSHDYIHYLSYCYYTVYFCMTCCVVLIGFSLSLCWISLFVPTLWKPSARPCFIQHVKRPWTHYSMLKSTCKCLIDWMWKCFWLPACFVTGILPREQLSRRFHWLTRASFIWSTTFSGIWASKTRPMPTR